jgi:hypothetical protein
MRQQVLVEELFLIDGPEDVERTMYRARQLVTFGLQVAEPKSQPARVVPNDRIQG